MQKQDKKAQKKINRRKVVVLGENNAGVKEIRENDKAGIIEVNNTDKTLTEENPVADKK